MFVKPGFSFLGSILKGICQNRSSHIIGIEHLRYYITYLPNFTVVLDAPANKDEGVAILQVLGVLASVVAEVPGKNIEQGGSNDRRSWLGQERDIDGTEAPVL